MKIIIAGAYAIGSYLASLLTRTNEDITIIDEDEEAIDALSSELDVLTMHASPISIKALKSIGVGDTDLFRLVILKQHIVTGLILLDH